MTHKTLTEVEISELLLEEDDDGDGLDSISVDDDDGSDDGPDESEEVLRLVQPALLSPGSQDMFDELPSPSKEPSFPCAKRQRPSSPVAATSTEEPPAKRQRRQQHNSGKSCVSYSGSLGTEYPCVKKLVCKWHARNQVVFCCKSCAIYCMYRVYKPVTFCSPFGHQDYNLVILAGSF
jgi:hypothetical protein